MTKFFTITHFNIVLYLFKFLNHLIIIKTTFFVIKYHYCEFTMPLFNFKLLKSYAFNKNFSIKGNKNSRGEKIYHMPGQQFYDKTNAEETFCSEADAKAAGYRAAGYRASKK